MNKLTAVDCQTIMSEPNSNDYDVPTAIGTIATTHAGQFEGSQKRRLSVSLSVLDSPEEQTSGDQDSTQRETPNSPVSINTAASSQEASETESSDSLERGEQSEPNSSQKPVSEEEGDGYMNMSGGDDSQEPFYDVVRGENGLEGTENQTEPDTIEEEEVTPPDCIRPTRPLKQPLPVIQTMEAPGLDIKVRPGGAPDMSGLDNKSRKHEEMYDTISDSKNTGTHHHVMLWGVVIVIGIVACLALSLCVGHFAASWEKISSDKAGHKDVQALISRIEILENQMNGTKPHPLNEEDWTTIQGMIRQQIQQQFVDYESRLFRLETSLTSTLNDTIEDVTKLTKQQVVNKETLDDQERTLTRLEINLETFMNETQMQVSNFSAQFEETRRRLELLEDGQASIHELVNQSRLDTTREFSHVRTELSETTNILTGQFIRLNERTENFETESRQDIASLYQSLNMTTGALYGLRSDFTSHVGVFNEEVMDTKENFTIISTRLDVNHATLQAQLENVTLQVREDLTTELRDTEKQLNSQLQNLTSEMYSNFEDVHEELNETSAHFDGRLNEQTYEVNSLRKDFQAQLENVTLQVRDNFTDLTTEIRDTEILFTSQLHNFTNETQNNFEELHEKLNNTRAHFDGRLNEHTLRIGQIETDLSGTREDLGTATQRISEVETSLSGTREDLGTATQRISEVETGLSGTREDLGTATQRISEVETGLSGTREDLGTATQRISEVETSLTGTREDLGTATQRITQLETGHRTITTHLNNARNDIRSLRQEQTSNGNTLTGHDRRLSYLESDVRDLKSSGVTVSASYTTILVVCLMTMYIVWFGM